MLMKYNMFLLTTQIALSLRFFMISLVSFTIVLVGVLAGRDAVVTSRAPCRGHLGSWGGGWVGWAGVKFSWMLGALWWWFCS